MKIGLVLFFVLFTFLGFAQDNGSQNSRSEADEYRQYETELGKEQGKFNYENRKNFTKNFQDQTGSKSKEDEKARKVKIDKFSNFLKSFKKDQHQVEEEPPADSP